MKCPKCSRHVMHKTEDGHLRFRIDGKISLGPDGLVSAQCFYCKSALKVPLTLKKSEIQPKFLISVDDTKG